MRYNSTILRITGIGDDYFYLNGGLCKGKTLLDYDTLYDYDEADHRYQEYARERDFPGYKAQPYYGSLYQLWARLLIDGAFNYASLSMASGYIYSQLESAGFDQIDKLIPYRYVLGPNHGKREGKGTRWDRRISANGKEAHLDELKERFYRYTEERRQVLARQFDSQVEGRVYLITQNQSGDPHTHFIFTDKTVLQAVRFRHFVRDCRIHLSENQALDTLIDQEYPALNAFLEKNCQDILDNFDSTVVKFKKKRTIVLSDDALNDLI